MQILYPDWIAQRPTLASFTVACEQQNKRETEKRIIFSSILLSSFNYLAMLNSFQFLFTSLPRNWAEGY